MAGRFPGADSLEEFFQEFPELEAFLPLGDIILGELKEFLLEGIL